MAYFLIALSLIASIITATFITNQNKVIDSSKTSVTLAKDSIESSFTQLRDLFLESRDNPTSICGGATSYNSCPQLYSVYVPQTGNTSNYGSSSGIPSNTFTGTNYCVSNSNPSVQVPPSSSGTCPAGYTLSTTPQSYPTTYGTNIPNSSQNPPTCNYIANCQDFHPYNGYTNPALLSNAAAMPTYPDWCAYRYNYVEEIQGPCTASTSSPPSTTTICAAYGGTVPAGYTATTLSGPTTDYTKCSSTANEWGIQQNIFLQGWVTQAISGHPYWTDQASCDSYRNANGMSGGSYRCAQVIFHCTAYNTTFTSTPYSPTPTTAPQCNPNGGGLLSPLTGPVLTAITGQAATSGVSPSVAQPNSSVSNPGPYQTIYYLDPNKLAYNVQNSLAAAGELPRPIGFDWVRNTDGTIKYIIPSSSANVDPQGFRDVYICLASAGSKAVGNVSKTTYSGQALINAVADLNKRYETMDPNCNISGACKVKLITLTNGTCDPQAGQPWTPANGIDNVAIVWDLGQIKPKVNCSNGTTSQDANSQGNCPTGYTRNDWQTRFMNP